MSKINTPEFKHFEIELRRDSGTSSMSGSRESGLDSCFIDKCNHKDKSKSGVDSLAEGGVLVWTVNLFEIKDAYTLLLFPHSFDLK